MKKVQHTFATFPEFSKLTLADRDAYEKLIENYPAYSDFSFPAMQTWWNVLGSCRVSQLNGNLVLSYWIPGDDKGSGLSVVGTQMIDETLCTLFDYMKERDENPRLVHVPEFVLNHVHYPDLFISKSERSFDECVLSVRKFASKDSMGSLFRWKVNRFLASHDEEDVQLKSLDLSDPQNKELLADCYNDWKNLSAINNLNQAAEDSMYTYIQNANLLGIENLTIFYKGKLEGYILYSLPADADYVIVTYGKFSYSSPGLFEYSIFRFAKLFAQQRIKKVNIDIDAGNLVYRMIQLSLGPDHFFRKYTVTPK